MAPSMKKSFNEIKQYYYAASTWEDSFIGYVMEFVDTHEAYSENTTLIFISDHGFARGEHGMFCKNALFDQQTRVAFVVAPAKSMQNVDRGKVRTEPVNLVDLFPTIVHMGAGRVLPDNAIVDNSNCRSMAAV